MVGIENSSENDKKNKLFFFNEQSKFGDINYQPFLYENAV